MSEIGLYCMKCGEREALDPFQALNGRRMRKAVVSGIRVPPNHGFRMQGFFHLVKEVKCNRCDAVIQRNTRAIAVTYWWAEGYRAEPEPEIWEDKFGDPKYEGSDQGRRPDQVG